ncbi:MAG: glycoside hydrolase family 28 protein [Prevotella sp.]|nr:glycoside hydrolase family 28 protein [Prevotella sp.]
MNKLLTFLLLVLFSVTASAGSYTALRDSILQQVTGATLQTNEVLLTRFGARGDSATDCHPAFVKAMKYAKKRGGAKIVLTPGIWLCRGPIHLVDNVTLVIREGATLKFVADPPAYLPMVETSWEGTWLWNYSPFIYGKGLRNVFIVGNGIIDGDSGDTFAKWYGSQQRGQMLSRQMNHDGVPVGERRFGQGFDLRPQLIQLYDCHDVTISSVFIRRSPFWCVHILKCENVILRGLRYDAKLVNNDGIDIESSRNVLIDDVRFNNGDDNIAIKSGRDNDGWTLCPPSENILIRRCHFKGLHAVVIGSEMSGGIRNVVIENCGYYGYCKRGIFIKTNPDRGGFVSNIFVRNVHFGQVLDLFYVTSMYAGQGLDNNHFTTIENIHVDSLSARQVDGTCLVLQGTREKPIRNVSFRRIIVDELKNGCSFENTDPVMIADSHLGPLVGIPSQVSESDKIFEKNNK